MQLFRVQVLGILEQLGLCFDWIMQEFSDCVCVIWFLGVLVLYFFLENVVNYFQVCIVCIKYFIV